MPNAQRAADITEAARLRILAAHLRGGGPLPRHEASAIADDLDACAGGEMSLGEAVDKGESYSGYEDDAGYGGSLPGGGYWETIWGVRLNMTFGPVTRTDVPAVPLPATALLLAAGVGFLGAAARRRPAR